MGCLNSAISWFDAARDGDLEFVQQMAYLYVNTQDTRNNPNEHQLVSFSALHYSMYFGHFEVSKFLIEYEYSQFTSTYLSLNVLKSDKQLVSITVPPHVSALHMASLTGNWNIIDFIFEQLKTFPVYYKMLNGSPKNYSVLMLLILTNDYKQTIQLIETHWQSFLRTELLRSSDFSFIQLSVAIGNIEMLKFFLQLIASEGFHDTTFQMIKKYRYDAVVIQTIKKNFGNSILQAVDQNKVQECVGIINDFLDGIFPPVPNWMGGPQRPEKILMKDYDKEFQQKLQNNSWKADEVEDMVMEEVVHSQVYVPGMRRSLSYKFMQKVASFSISDEEVENLPKVSLLLKHCQNNGRASYVPQFEQATEVGFAMFQPADCRDRVDSIAQFLEQQKLI